jgi:hypothetical protein
MHGVDGCGMGATAARGLLLPVPGCNRNLNVDQPNVVVWCDMSLSNYAKRKQTGD